MTTKNVLRNQCFPSYQTLETRNLLAGNVAVFENVNLYIRGDQFDNQFEIVVEDNQLKINGLNGTTINGNQEYVVQSAFETDSGITLNGGLRAHLGPGHDDFSVRDAQFESLSVIYGGTGNDRLDIVDSRFLEKVTLQTFNGNDIVTAKRSHFGDEFYAITLDGQDSVAIDDSVFTGDSIVATGEHKDSIHSSSNHYMGDVSLILPQNGDDTVQLNDPVVGENRLGVFLGNGDDAIGAEMDRADVEGQIVISGQAGIDETLGMSMNDEIEGQTTLRSIEKGELVFESGVEGIENVAAGAVSYTTTFEPGEEGEYTYIEQYATPVVLETTETITQFEWSGLYVRDYLFHGYELEDRGDSFFIEIFEDAGDGAPDIESVVRFDAGDGNRAEAGGVEIEYYGTAPLYSYHAEVEYVMEAGKQYWVSIFTELDGVEYEFQNHWSWGYGIDYDARSTVFNQGSGKYIDDWRRYGGDPYTLAGFEMDLRLRV